MKLLTYTPPHLREKPSKPRRKRTAKPSHRSETAEVKKYLLPGLQNGYAGRVMSSGRVAFVIGKSAEECTWMVTDAEPFKDWLGKMYRSLGGVAIP